MATNDVRTMWQRTASNRVQDDSIRAPKLAHCRSFPKPQPEMCHYEMVRGFEQTPSYYWSNSWSSLDTKTVLQMSPSATCDHRSEYLAWDEILGSRSLKPAGLQALAAERGINMKSSGAMGVNSEDATGAELELEWQLIMDPKHKSGLSASFRAAEAKKRNSEFNINTAEEAKDSEIESITSCEQNLRDSKMSKSLRDSGEVCPQSSRGGDMEELMSRPRFEDCMETCQQLRKKCFYGSQSLCITGTTSPSTVTSSVSWRTASKETLAALVAQKAKELLENCDLPTPLSRSVVKTPTESFYLMEDAQPEPWESFDGNVKDSILQAGEPTRCESLGIPASTNMSEKGEASSLVGQFTRMSLPLSIPIKGQASSATLRGCQSSRSSCSFAEDKHASWTRGDKVTSSSLGRSSGPLGEALCHSQSRAREAEKRAQESFQDYQKVAHLFFREASLSLTYRQWVSSLQAENARLKLYVHRHQQAAVWIQQSFISPFSVLDRFSRRNTYEQDDARRHIREQLSTLWPAEKENPASFVVAGEGGAEIIMGCTLSFAFALGLSLAGAGLMLGWSMGWIRLAY